MQPLWIPDVDIRVHSRQALRPAGPFGDQTWFERSGPISGLLEGDVPDLGHSRISLPQVMIEEAPAQTF